MTRAKRGQVSGSTYCGCIYKNDEGRLKNQRRGLVETAEGELLVIGIKTEETDKPASIRMPLKIMKGCMGLKEGILVCRRALHNTVGLPHSQAQLKQAPGVYKHFLFNKEWALFKLWFDYTPFTQQQIIYTVRQISFLLCIRMQLDDFYS